MMALLSTTKSMMESKMSLAAVTQLGSYIVPG